MTFSFYYTRRAVVFYEDDIGGRIICYPTPRGVVRCWLWRGRFIRGLPEWSVEVVGLFEACYPGGCRKGKGCSLTNNLHVEVHAVAWIAPESYHTREELAEAVRDKVEQCEERVREAFLELGVQPESIEVVTHSIEAPREAAILSRCVPGTTMPVRVSVGLRC